MYDLLPCLASVKGFCFFKSASGLCSMFPTSRQQLVGSAGSGRVQRLSACLCVFMSRCLIKPHYFMKKSSLSKDELSLSLLCNVFVSFYAIQVEGVSTFLLKLKSLKLI